MFAMLLARAAASGVFALFCLFALGRADAQCPGQWLPGEGGADGQTLPAMVEWDSDGPGPMEPYLVISGGFASAPVGAMTKVACFDGQRLFELGEALAYCDALVVLRGELIGSGTTQYSDGTTRYVSRWDGAAWRPLGGGVLGRVSGMTVYDDALYVSCAPVGSTGDGMIRRWDGAAWSDVARITPLASFPFRVRFSVVNGALVAAGSFTQIGGTGANCIASWNGQSWSPYGNGFYGAVTDVIEFQGALHACCTAGALGGVYRWDGVAWRSLGALAFQSVPRVLVDFEDRLVVGGEMNRSHGFEMWTGNAWEPCFPDAPILISEARIYRGELWVVGAFSVAHYDIPADLSLACLNGSSWRTFGRRALNDRVFAAAAYGGDIVLGGAFTQTPSEPASHIVRWRGGEWHTMDSGVNGFVHALCEHDANLVVGGGFSAAGGTPARGIARWDGATWSPMGEGVGGTVTALCGFRGDMFAGGTLVASDNTLGVASWDGQAWRSVGGGVRSLGPLTLVNALAVFHDELYVAGVFSFAGQVPAVSIARWDGDRWRSVGNGFGTPQQPHVVASLTVWEDSLIAVVRGAVWRWDGGAWSLMPEAPLGSRVVGVYRGDLVVGGSAGMLRRFDGAVWSDFGAGITGNISCINSVGDYLVLGGDIAAAGSHPSRYWARWADLPQPPFLTLAPESTTVAVGASLHLTAGTWGSHPLNYRWRRNGQFLEDGPCTRGARSPTLRIDSADASIAGVYELVVQNVCGSVTFQPATVAVRDCLADVDDGAGRGQSDGGVTIDDLLFFLVLFDAGDVRTDVDDGSGTGTRDGGVTIDDLLYFLTRFAAGC